MPTVLVGTLNACHRRLSPNANLISRTTMIRKLVLALLLGLITTAGHAEAGVRLNIGFNIPLFYPRPRPVYVAPPPPPVYVVPAAPVYVRSPAPVYVQPAP